MAAESRIRVLLVDDNAADVKLLRLWIARIPAVGTIESVGTGREALEWVRRASSSNGDDLPGLVLMDANLPDMVGWELLEEMRTNPGLSDFDVMMLSGSCGPGDDHRARELGAVAFLTKPFDVDDFGELLRRIEEHLARRRTDP
jgi:CheY-like chemotaxis protein